MSKLPWKKSRFWATAVVFLGDSVGGGLLREEKSLAMRCPFAPPTFCLSADE